MTHLQSALRLLFAAGAFFMLCAGAEAQSPIVYVSASGSDSNNCTFAAPCRLFQRAVNVVPAGGVVQVLNSAGYGNVTIKKSLTISGGGNIVATGHRIVIDSASAVVVLRDLVMDGRGVGATGILIDNAAAVHIEDCEIERYTGAGIRLDVADTKLFVTDSVSRDNGGGLRIDGIGTSAMLTVDNSRFVNNSIVGLDIYGIQSTITRSVASGNGQYGIYQGGGTATIAWTTVANNGFGGIGYVVADSGHMTLESSVARSSYNGLAVNTGTTARISNSVFTNNIIGINNNGTVLTWQNNKVSGNTTDTTGNTFQVLTQY